MKALLFTNEYPPNIYGGAGVHIAYLSRELSRLMPVEVRCFGDQFETRPDLAIRGFGVDTSVYTCPRPLHSVFGALQRGLDFNTMAIDADLVHCHTWYTHFAGIAAKLNYGIPLVLTVHSLEPLRPWKREQLGGGYDFSCWIEKTALEMADAVIAVSEATRYDVRRLFNVSDERLHVIHNGIDLDEYRPVESHTRIERLGIDSRQPYILFVGRITRQKGIIHLVNAIKHLDRDFQIVLCAGAPDTPEIAAEMKAAVAEAQSERPGIIWLEQMLDDTVKVELYSRAALFVCPSVYEPFGIINLEAMACATPIVASNVGGIPEVVVDGETGLLIPLDCASDAPIPRDPAAFSLALADAINTLMRGPSRRVAMGRAGRARAEAHFGWPAIARKTAALYKETLGV